MSELSDSLYEYVKALVTNWIWLMSAGPFLIEKIWKYFSITTYERLVSRHLNASVGRFLIYIIAIVGLFIASFLSFRQERLLALAANNGSIPYQPIEKDKLEHLVSLVAKMDPKPTVLIGWDGDTSTFRVARQLYDAFKADNIDAPPQRGARDRDDEFGLQLSVGDRYNLTLAQQEIVSAFKNSKIPLTIEALAPDDVGRRFSVAIFVCPRGPK